MSGLSIIFNLGIFNLKEQRPLLCVRIILLCHSVSRPTNFNSLSWVDVPLVGLGHGGGVLGLPRRPLGEVGLVALPLRVGQVVPLVVVESQAQLALVASQVVPHEVGVLDEVDGLQRQSPEPLAAVDRLVLGGGGASAARLFSFSFSFSTLSKP